MICHTKWERPSWSVSGARNLGQPPTSVAPTRPRAWCPFAVSFLGQGSPTEIQEKGWCPDSILTPFNRGKNVYFRVALFYSKTQGSLWTVANRLQETVGTLLTSPQVSHMGKAVAPGAIDQPHAPLQGTRWWRVSWRCAWRRRWRRPSYGDSTADIAWRCSSGTCPEAPWLRSGKPNVNPGTTVEPPA